MKIIWGIYIRDLKKISRNVTALIVVAGLAILPSLYAWFNIMASWDPYGNTKGIKVAVASDDKGALLEGININIGNEVIENLKGNAQMGWQFVDSNEAIEGSKSGRYYAAIVIPEDFSEKMSSIILNGYIERPTIDYYVNEKKNAISPKITDKGVSSIQLKINETFIQVATETIFTLLNLTEKSLTENGNDPITNLINTFENANENLFEFSQAIKAFEEVTLAIQDINNTLEVLVPEN